MQRRRPQRGRTAGPASPSSLWLFAHGQWPSSALRCLRREQLLRPSFRRPLPTVPPSPANGLQPPRLCPPLEKVTRVCDPTNLSGPVTCLFSSQPQTLKGSPVLTRREGGGCGEHELWPRGAAGGHTPFASSCLKEARGLLLLVAEPKAEMAGRPGSGTAGTSGQPPSASGSPPTSLNTPA